MKNDFAYYLNLYFNDYLIIQRNFSDKSIISYKTTFKLLIKYLQEHENIKIKDLNFDVITKEIILKFLKYLEEVRKCSINTRNQRLACIKSFYDYVSNDIDVIHFNNIQKIMNIKNKKGEKKIPVYLTKEELELFFSKIDTTTKKGRRDYILLTLLYDSAARSSEILNLKVEDLNLTDKPSVKLEGKGKKIRVIPISIVVKDNILKYIDENKIPNLDFLFNNKSKKMNSKFIMNIIEKYNNNPKSISPHTFRHSKSIYMLEDGIPLIYIKDFLGHESVTTTEKYLQISEEFKRRCHEKLEHNKNISEIKDWTKDENLLNELLAL